jgi:type IV secretory pathway VirB3-like protein
MKNFFDELRVQRWDDHRYYHQSRINQAVHFISAISFLVAYAVMFNDPATAALIAWLISMTTRQSGHFFFEPQGYDEVNQATNEYKEEVKVGYNLARKRILMGSWILLPVFIWFAPDLLPFVSDHAGVTDWARDVGWAWFWLGIGALVFRMAQLTKQQSFKTAVVWICKIITDPFHDIKLYWKAPYYLLKGELLDTSMRKGLSH